MNYTKSCLLDEQNNLITETKIGIRPLLQPGALKYEQKLPQSHTSFNLTNLNCDKITYFPGEKFKKF